MMTNPYFFVLLFLISTCSYTFGLKILIFRVPPQRLRASDATLRCIYDLQGSTLYSVQWYKDNSVFFRYVPADSPPGQMFPIPGVTVDLQNSNSTQVILHLLDLESSGTYKCEVSTEAPKFLTESEEGPMVVMALPRDAPKVTGLAGAYNEGEPINLNCTSARSKPVAVLSWFINGNQVNKSQPYKVVPTGKERKEGPFLTQYRVVTGQDHMEQVTLGLRMATSKKFFNNILHTMKIRCTASMGVLMWHSEHTTRIHSRSSAPPITEMRPWMVCLLAAFLCWNSR